MSNETSDLELFVTASKRQEFIDCLEVAYKASQGDSNDAEIEALWDVAGMACELLKTYRDEDEDA